MGVQKSTISMQGKISSCGGCYTVMCKFLTNGLLRHTIQDKNTEKYSKNREKRWLL